MVREKQDSYGSHTFWGFFPGGLACPGLWGKVASEEGRRAHEGPAGADRLAEASKDKQVFSRVSGLCQSREAAGRSAD